MLQLGLLPAAVERSLALSAARQAPEVSPSTTPQVSLQLGDWSLRGLVQELSVYASKLHCPESMPQHQSS